MLCWAGNIEAETLKNTFFRKVLYTDARVQLVVMSLGPGEEVGEESHPYLDQFIRVEAGRGTAVLEGQERPLADGAAFVIPAGVSHNIINTGEVPLKLYTIYAPPEHAPGTVHRTKAEALASEEHYEAPAAPF